MTLQSVLLAGRSAAEARMTSRATAKRPVLDADGSPVTTTDANDYEVPVWEILHVDLPLRLAGIRSGPAQTRSVTSGGVEVELAVRSAHVPVWANDLRDGDLLEVTAGENMGVFLRVVEASWQDQATARRLPVIEAQEPKGWAV